MDKLKILQKMIDAAGKHNLQMEVLMSLINDISRLSKEELESACNRALIEWDI